MLEVSRNKVSTEYSNLMSFHAGKAYGLLVLLDKFSQSELKYYAMIGLEKAVRDILGRKADTDDLTPEEVRNAVESLLSD